MKKLNGKKLILVAPILAIALLFLGGCEHYGWRHWHPHWRHWHHHGRH